MHQPIMSQRKADTLSLGLFLILLGLISYTGAWWPEILLAVGAMLCLRQYLRKRLYDLFLSVVIFGGLYLFFKFNVNWAIVLPVCFTLGGIYLILREYFETKYRDPEERAEDLSQEVSEDEKRR